MKLDFIRAGVFGEHINLGVPTFISLFVNL